MKAAIRSSHALLQTLGLTTELADDTQDFPTLVPGAFARRMAPGDAADPLLRQVLASPAERLNDPEFSIDPLQETAPGSGYERAPGLLQKYHGRALLITTGACAVHCRYCFRRHFPYAEHRGDQFSGALDTIAADSSVEEVILSGGDPLMLEDEPLQRLIERIERIEHVQRLRVHTRMPVVLPSRVTTSLLDSLSGTRLDTVVVIHANHANELDDDTARALACLSNAGLPLLNQAVLMRGVNDRIDTQVALCKKLFAQRVLPYYLHLTDPVAGTSHFFLTRARAMEIYAGMQAKLSGYLLPRLVQEVPGKASKVIVSG